MCLSVFPSVCLFIYMYVCVCGMFAQIVSKNDCRKVGHVLMAENILKWTRRETTTRRGSFHVNSLTHSIRRCSHCIRHINRCTIIFHALKLRVTTHLAFVSYHFPRLSVIIIYTSHFMFNSVFHLFSSFVPFFHLTIKNTFTF